VNYHRSRPGPTRREYGAGVAVATRAAPISFLFLLKVFVAAFLATGLLAIALGLAGCGPTKQNATWQTSPQQAQTSTQADDEFEKGKDRPPTAQTLHALARLCATDGQDGRCEQVLRQILTKYPTFMPAYVDLAELQVRQRRLDDAIGTLDAASKISAHDPVVLNDQGMCWLIKGEYDKAFEYFSKASALQPNNARYRGNMALALGMLGRYDEAFSLYEQVLSPADAHANLAVLCDARHDQKRAAQERLAAATAGQLPAVK
jgi:tetratricopeptide (TPR) repeat protein